MPEFKELQINNGKILLNIARGEVVGQQKWSETEVHSSGGGGYVQQGGYVRPPQVSSTSHEKHEFWIREEDGKEIAINFTDANFPVREGQKVWVAWGNNNRSKGNSSYLFGYNYASGNSCDLLGNWDAWMRGSGLFKPPFLYRLLTTWLSLVIGIIIGFVWFPLFASSEIMTDLSNLMNPLFIIQHWPVAMSRLISNGIANGIANGVGISVSLGIMALVAGSIWIGNTFFLKLLGSLFFLKQWERKQIAAIRTRVFHACQAQI